MASAVRSPSAGSAAQANSVSTPSGKLCSSSAVPVTSAVRSAAERSPAVPYRRAKSASSGKRRPSSAAVSIPSASSPPAAAPQAVGGKKAAYCASASGRRSSSEAVSMTPAAKPDPAANIRRSGRIGSASSPPSAVESPASVVNKKGNGNTSLNVNICAAAHGYVAAARKTWYNYAN